jgi:hypothetical protein
MMTGNSPQRVFIYDTANGGEIDKKKKGGEEKGKKIM